MATHDMTLQRILSQALRMTLRDWRAGELRLLAAALVIAVAAVTSVGFFVDRIGIGLKRDATQLLGADVVVSSDQPITAELSDRARRDGLQVANTVTFPSMAISAANPRLNSLSAIKAVSAGYPLRGAVRVQQNLAAPDREARRVPEAGTVWIDAQIAVQLRIGVGDPLKLGEATFKVGELISVEPDRGAGFLNFAPRVMLNLAD